MKSYKEKLELVCDFITANLDDDLSLDSLSRVIGISKHHFHRIFAAGVGVNVYAYIQLRRLKRASYQLVFHKETKILDIALDARFDSHEAFSRSFKKVFGVTPTQFRTNPHWEQWHEKYQFEKLSGGREMDVKIVEMEEIKIAVLEHRGAPERLNHSIPKFIEWRKTTGLSPIETSRTFGLVYHDPHNTPAEDFRFDICGEITEKLSENEFGIIEKKIPRGRCAVLRHVGPHAAMDAKIYELYKNWLPTSEFEVRDFPLFFQYQNFFPETAESELITDIFLPLK